MIIKTIVSDIADHLQDFMKVERNKMAFLTLSYGGTATIKITQTQIKGNVMHKNGSETKLKTIGIKVK